jgi:hypothetical protein
VVTATDVPVLVPRREDRGRRDEIWALLQTHAWLGAHVIEGHHTEGPFNRSAALNLAAAAAGDWDLAVIADSDSFVPAGQLHGALQLAERHDRVVIAHSRWVNVEPDETEQMLVEGWIEHRDNRDQWTFTVSSMLVVPRAAWDAVNGFDERFQGWGREDNAFIRAIKILHQPPLRIDGTVYHLAHDRPTEDVNRTRSPLFRANEARWRQYMTARTPDQMRAIVAGNRTPVLA